jgi:hypothetical protein
VCAAAAQARRAITGDRTLAPAHAQIAELVARAAELERCRRGAAGRLDRIDRLELAAKRAAWSRSTAPGAADTMALLAAEEAEADRLAADQAASVAGLERIAAALRIVPLRARDAGPRRTGADPVDALLGELAARDAALEATERALG